MCQQVSPYKTNCTKWSSEVHVCQSGKQPLYVCDL